MVVGAGLLDVKVEVILIVLPDDTLVRIEVEVSTGVVVAVVEGRVAEVVVDDDEGGGGLGVVS